MIIDRETFTELAVHLKHASDAILNTAHNLAVVGSEESPSTQDAAWKGTLESMMALNDQVTVMERLLRAVLAANVPDEEDRASSQRLTH
jgi:hypothetical protein